MIKERFCTALLAAFCVAVTVVFLEYKPFLQIHWTYTQTTTIIDRTSTEPSNPSTSLNGYVLVMRYSGQQGAGVAALVALQRWVRDVRLPMLIVEPFIQNSVLGAYRESLKFSDVFDLESFNRASRSEGMPEVVPWDAYVSRAPPNAVLVRIRGVPRPGPLPPLEVVWAAQPGSTECWHGRGGHNNIKINNRSLCYVRTVLASFMFASKETISSAEVCNTLLSGVEPTTVTVVFELWRGPWEVDDPLLPPPASCTYASKGLNLEYNGSVTLTPKLHDSPKLLRDIENYQQQFLRQSAGLSYVAVMLRAEHAFLMVNQVKNSIKHFNMLIQLHNCLNEVVKKTTVVKTELRTQNVFVTADIGLYGSSSWQKTMSPDYTSNGEVGKVEEQVKHTVEGLYNRQWTFEQWENSFSQATGGMEDKGYIAAVQKGIASQAACLILLGGGSFQILALKSYVERVEPHRRCVHFVCTDRTSRTELYALKNSSYFS